MSDSPKVIHGSASDSFVELRGNILERRIASKRSSIDWQELIFLPSKEVDLSPFLEARPMEPVGRLRDSNS